MTDMQLVGVIAEVSMKPLVFEYIYCMISDKCFLSFLNHLGGLIHSIGIGMFEVVGINSNSWNHAEGTKEYKEFECDSELPGVYVDVYHYKSWIMDHITAVP